MVTYDCHDTRVLNFGTTVEWTNDIELKYIEPNLDSK